MSREVALIEFCALGMHFTVALQWVAQRVALIGFQSDQLRIESTASPTVVASTST